MNIKDVLYLPSGRIFLVYSDDGYLIETTEMRDVAVSGKENYEVRNTEDPHVIWKHLKPFEEKWLLTVSTQKGCTHNCQFCDVAELPYKGNLSQKEIEGQIHTLLENTPYVHKSNKVKIGFARMGEPAHNLDNVLGAMESLPRISSTHEREFKWLPCFNTILPRNIKSLSGSKVLHEVIDFKENIYDGRLHLQLSMNSTDEEKRRELFGTDVLTTKEIIEEVNKREITDRTVTLNYIVMDGVEVDVEKLKNFGLNSDKFRVKLIPLNDTENSKDNSLETYANYKNYEKLEKLGKQFNDVGVPTVIDAIAKCEEAGLCCGQLAQIYS
ncbi:MAG: hypothetical protein ACOC22_04385 [bacterium]